MKLFLRNHVPFITMNIIQLLFIIMIFILDGYRHYKIALYALFIAVFLLTIFLIWRYMTHRNFYQRLTFSMKELDEALESLDNTPLSQALSKLLKSQYAQYMNELLLQEKRRTQHLTFMNQWIHQMKTPLSVIELITQENDDENFQSIREEAEKIGKGLEMVLYAARLENFEHDFRIETVSLRKVTEDAIGQNKRLFIKSYVYPEVDVDNVVIESDEKWLTFIINQLITNAVKYSAGKAKKIIISSSGAMITIQDFGVGIPKTDIKRVFSPFYTGENGRLYRESTGMGLYLVKEVCDKLGHQIKIESEVNKGTIVKITFS